MIGTLWETNVAKPLYTISFYTDKKKEVRYRIVHRNGNTILDCGEGYKKQGAAKRALNNFLKAVTEDKVAVTEDVK